MAIVGVGALLWSAAPLLAQDPAVTPRDTTATVRPIYRSSAVVGMTVKNMAGETVGSIDDLVLDAKTGKIRYVALSVGGFLGIGNRLFAIPWSSLDLKQEGHSSHFVLDVDKEKLKNAPGFDKNNWPDLADPRFGADVDRYFGVEPSKTEPPAQR